MSAKIPYRADIDGLRAIAVLMVVFFHLGLPGFSGGYVGVDVFFVISGFLITSIIFSDLEKGEFSLSDFYERRIKRIFPALFLVLLVSTIVASFALFPDEFEIFGQSLSSAAVFGSNIFFWKQSGYFEPEASFMPLLHIWSLAVEEQFYILFPLYLIGIFKFFRGLLIPLTFLGLILSFGMNVLALDLGKISATFYLLPTRAWELLIGAMLAITALPATNKIVKDILATLGLCMIFASGFFFDNSTSFPDYNALLPTIGAALLIYAGQENQTIFSKLLSYKAPVFIGKISYSLYLWHWPIIAFYTYASPFEVDAKTGTVLFILSLALSYLTWRFIEQPARQYKTKNTKRIFILGLSISLFFLVTGLLISQMKGLPERFSPEIQKLSSTSIGLKRLEKSNIFNFDGITGTIGDPEEKASFIAWGDSHLKAMAPGLEVQAKQAKRNGYYFEDAGCMPAFDKIKIFPETCQNFSLQVLNFIEKHPDIDRIIIVADWYTYRKKVASKLGEDVFKSQIENILSKLNKLEKDIYFVKTVPIMTLSKPSLDLAKARRFGLDLNADLKKEEYESQQAPLDKILKALKRKYEFKTLDPAALLCNKTVCKAEEGERSLYYDSGHISNYGAQYIMDIYKPAFKNR